MVRTSTKLKGVIWLMLLPLFQGAHALFAYAGLAALVNLLL